MQRLRVGFSRGEATKYISHLDMMRYWERAFRRAGFRITMSQGFHPHPRFSLASPLPVGVTSEGEVLDVYLDDFVEPRDFLKRLSPQMVPSIQVLTVEEASLQSPSLQAALRFSDYTVTVEAQASFDEAQQRVAQLLAQTALPWEHVRDGDRKAYDLRPLINQLSVAEARQGTVVLAMRLKTDSSASGRPEQVARALGFEEPPLAVHRVRLLFEDDPTPKGIRQMRATRPSL